VGADTLSWATSTRSVSSRAALVSSQPILQTDHDSLRQLGLVSRKTRQDRSNRSVQLAGTDMCA
jgi:hypothetical protein